VSKLLALVHIVKIDLTTLDRVSLTEIYKRFRLHRVKLLASNVETLDDLAFCQRLGFDYLQGYFLCKPRIVAGRRLDASRSVVMRSLAQIQDSTADFQSLAKIIAQDVSLSYKLLKLVNSAYYSLSKTITSLEQAVALIGLNQLRAWMTLLLMASVRNKPHELTTLALSRAKTCELLAKTKGERQTDPFFLVGLFSILDALMDLPMPEAIGSLPLSDDIINALLHHRGPLGDVLRLALAYERGQWDYVLKTKTGLKPEAIGASYLEAVRWTVEALRAMNA
jgi:EAL and modified HD-GYP domain-containing signal transduction protein